jgi:hypothetical protein
MRPRLLLTPSRILALTAELATQCKLFLFRKPGLASAEVAHHAGVHFENSVVTRPIRLIKYSPKILRAELPVQRNRILKCFTSSLFVIDTGISSCLNGIAEMVHTVHDYDKAPHPLTILVVESIPHLHINLSRLDKMSAPECFAVVQKVAIVRHIDRV